ncbi:MAG: lysophospholipid acyltransferase family protein [Thermodesulforhabdaceae bacterium]|jgi:lysophospholipid acyltransferase (LPLAT)-like uncharacterized protein
MSAAADKHKNLKGVWGKKRLFRWAIERLFVLIRNSCSYRVDGAGIIWKLFEKKKHVILTFWHKDVLSMLSFWSGLSSGIRIRGISRHDELSLSLLKRIPLQSCSAVMVSASQDGDRVSHFLESLGFLTIRGSSGSHGLRAGIGTIRYFKNRMNEPACVVMVADGSRGPARMVQKGVGHIARLTGSVILPAASSIYPAIKFPSWDRTLMPLPFSRIGIAVGNPVEPGEYGETDIIRKIQDSLDESCSRAAELVVF